MRDSRVIALIGVGVPTLLITLIMAGFIPGVVSAIIYAMLIIGQCVIDPSQGKPVESPPMMERLKTLPPVLPIFLVVGVIFYSMYTGKATPTEAGAVGAFMHPAS